MLWLFYPVDFRLQMLRPVVSLTVVFLYRIEGKHEVTILGGLNEFIVKFFGPAGSKSFVFTTKDSWIVVLAFGSFACSATYFQPSKTSDLKAKPLHLNIALHQKIMYSYTASFVFVKASNLSPDKLYINSHILLLSLKRSSI